MKYSYAKYGNDKSFFLLFGLFQGNITFTLKISSADIYYASSNRGE